MGTPVPWVGVGPSFSRYSQGIFGTHLLDVGGPVSTSGLLVLFLMVGIGLGSASPTDYLKNLQTAQHGVCEREPSLIGQAPGRFHIRVPVRSSSPDADGETAGNPWRFSFVRDTPAGSPPWGCFLVWGVVS